MKKVLVTMCVMALAIALSAPAFAGSYTGGPDFKMRGWMKVEGTTADNMDFNEDAADGRSYAYSRFRYWLDTSFDKKYGGTMGWEYDYTWGTSPGYATKSNAGDGAYGNDNAGTGELKHAYVWFLIPGTKIKTTGGLQSHVVDPDVMMFGSNTDWWSWRFDIPLGKMGKVTAAWLKQSEGVSTNNNDDADYYYVNLNLGFSKAFRLGFYEVLLISQGTDGSVTQATAGGSQIDGGYIDWVGVHLAYTPGAFYLNFHGNYMTGELDENDSTLGAAAGESISISGYALLMRLGMKMKSGLRIGLRSWYFTGEDDDATKITRWLDPDAFFCPTEIAYTGGRFWSTSSGAPGAGTPGGTYAVGPEGFIPFTKQLSLMPSIYWINWTDADNDNRAFFGDDSSIGYEIDLLLTYKPYKKLEMNFLVAYLLAGSGVDSAANADGDNAYEIGYRVLYTF